MQCNLSMRIGRDSLTQSVAFHQTGSKDEGDGKERSCEDLVSQDLLHYDPVCFSRQKLVQIDVPVVVRGTLSQPNKPQATAPADVKLLPRVLCHLDLLLYSVPENEESPRRDCVSDQQVLSKT